jgi:hypothetical protein
VGPSFIGARVAGSGAPQPADSDSAAARNFLSFNIGFAMSGLLLSEFSLCKFSDVRLLTSIMNRCEAGFVAIHAPLRNPESHQFHRDDKLPKHDHRVMTATFFDEVSSAG